MNVHSQNGEQPAILDYFGPRVGRFMDIGAWDGRTFSNTHAMALLGWSGVCVEPSPVSFVRLMETYRDRPGIVLVNAAVGDPGLCVFHDSGGDGISTTDASQCGRWRDSSFRPLWTNRSGVSELFGAFPGPFDFISIDAEGESVDILKSIPDSVMAGASLVCVEHDGREGEVRRSCEAHGIGRRILRNAENLIYGR